MKIEFSPFYSSDSYADWIVDGSVQIGDVVVGENQLLQLLEQSAGLRRPVVSQIEREAEYHNVIKQFIAGGNLCPMAKSFAKDPFNVGRVLLQWRDRLVLAGWHAAMNQPTARLAFLATIEPLFREVGVADRWRAVLVEAKLRPLFTVSTTLVVRHEAALLHPFFVELFEALALHGVSCSYDAISAPAAEGNLGRVAAALVSGERSVTLDETDRSIELLTFANEVEALDWVASSEAVEGELYVNSDNKRFDNVQRSHGAPLSGSQLLRSTPQVVQLFKLGVNLLCEPENIRQLLDWLYSPVHPLPSKLRGGLVRQILETGGVRNEKIIAEIKNYTTNLSYFGELKAELTSQEIARKLKRRKTRVETFLPKPDDELTLTRVREFVTELGSWAVTRAIAMDSKTDTDVDEVSKIDTILQRQLNELYTYCKAYVTLLENEQNESISPVLLRKLATSVCEASSYQQYEAEVGCRQVVSDAGSIAGNPNQIIWMGCNNAPTTASSYDFLSPREQEALKLCGVKIWEVEQECRLVAESYKLPFLRASERLTLLVCNSANGEATERHPIVLLLESICGKDLEKVTRRGEIDSDKLVEEEQRVFPASKTYYQIERGDLIKERELESFSSLEQLVQYPLDWVLNYSAKLRDRSLKEMMDLSRTSGIVVHNYLEFLCTKFDNDLEAMRNRVESHFQVDIMEMIYACGSILLLREHKIYLSRFELDARRSIKILFEIIEKNELRIVGCEAKVEGSLSKKEQSIAVSGDVDLILERPSGALVIIDLKWSSGSGKRYKQKVVEGRALQLAIYRSLAIQQYEKAVDAVAYFVMPANKLFTMDNIDGAELIEAEKFDDSHLIGQLLNSYRYRHDELHSGLLEGDINLKKEDCTYVNERGKKNLSWIDFDEDNDLKIENRFSSYHCLKGDIR